MGSLSMHSVRVGIQPTVAGVSKTYRNSRKAKRSWDENRQRSELEKFGRERFGVKELDDWYSVKAKIVRNRFKFIRNYGSVFDALKKLYPHHNWDPVRLSKVPMGYWRDKNVQREALERLGREKFGVKELDDWHSVAVDEVCSELSFISNYYNCSLLSALKKLYPQHDWDNPKVPVEHRDALEKLGRETLGVKQLDDWYSVSTTRVFQELLFLKKYGTLYDVLKTFYPQHKWDPLRFNRIPTGYWDDESNRRIALEKFGREKLGVKELDDWYSVTHVHCRELGFLHKYESLFDVLTKLYPQHNWDPVRFHRVPNGFWQRPNTIQYYQNLFTQWKNEYAIRTVSDWFRLPPHQVQAVKKVANGIFGSRMKMLEKWFPEIVWHSRFISQFEFQVLLQLCIELTVHRIYCNRQLQAPPSNIFDMAIIMEEKLPTQVRFNSIIKNQRTWCSNDDIQLNVKPEI